MALYGHVLAWARSYLAAIGYYARAYDRKQLQLDNRHIQVVCIDNQEAEYNIGRAFRHTGDDVEDETDLRSGI
ncbi:hypothetical protein Glove_242g27 [Diversispora epigaea]|uniref:Uncharacterized protein n=1 Tax=Diversispora epigaea TaxID=1348612 RepID=A0A397I9F3_9GLOM|nr:hypothetical protein Glove_242g27 [Diversispora epigaea]